MKNTLQINYWTIGGFAGEKPVEQALAEAKAMGFEGVELTFDGKEFGPGITEARCQEIRKAAKQLGVKIDTLASGYYWGCSLSSSKAEERKKAVAYTKEYLQVAKWVGAKTVLVVPGAVAVPWDASRPVTPYAEVWKNSTASLKQVLPTAKKLGVTIGLENVWNWFLADPIAMKTFVDQFKSPLIGVYFDVANCAINGYAEHWIEILGKRIKAIHFKNFSRSDCGGGIHGFGDDLLKGDVDLKSVVKSLAKIKYSGAVTAEMIPFSRLPDLVLPDMKLAKDTAKKLKGLFNRK
jgi:hexulose-6-phosphate isomerase